jgi:predicted phosphohydrolase
MSISTNSGLRWLDLSVYAISDLHLSLGAAKPMDIFGPGWHNYMDRIESEWRALIRDGDYVLLPGDFSWATYFDGALPDLRFVDALPGRKILSKGNHDYWWTTISKLKKFAFLHGLDSIEFLHNDGAVLDGGVGVAASRGWTVPGAPDFGEHDMKMYEREMIRTRLSFEALKRRLADDRGGADDTSRGAAAEDGGGARAPAGSGGVLEAPAASRIVLMMHYPPITNRIRSTGFSEIIREFAPDVCVYGHLHAGAIEYAYEGTQDGVDYRLVSADHLQFKPIKIA